MKIEPLTPSIASRICNHMNKDHKDALISFATRYGGILQPNQAKMIELTPVEMKLEVDEEIIEIPFNHTLIDSADAHRTLVEMLKTP